MNRIYAPVNTKTTKWFLTTSGDAILRQDISTLLCQEPFKSANHMFEFSNRNLVKDSLKCWLAELRQFAVKHTLSKALEARRE